MESGAGVVAVQGYYEDPDTPVGYHSPDPEEAYGGTLSIPETSITRTDIECSNNHYIRIAATDADLSEEHFLYGPIRENIARCPECQFGFAHREDLTIAAPGVKEGQFELQSVTSEPRARYKEVSSITREALKEHEQLAERNECPHCGSLVSFNYRV